jgi:hypothetical protein
MVGKTVERTAAERAAPRRIDPVEGLGNGGKGHGLNHES